jgi:Group II intron, maturase-specific domain
MNKKIDDHYYSAVVSTKTFHLLDHRLYEKLRRWAAIPEEALNPVFMGLCRLSFRKHLCHNVALIPTVCSFHVGGCDGHDGSQSTQTSVRRCPAEHAAKRLC